MWLVCSQLVAEFKRLGSVIVYANFNKIIICTKKHTIGDAIGYIEFVVQSIRNKELFHGIDISYLQCWEYLMWLDPVSRYHSVVAHNFLCSFLCRIYRHRLSVMNISDQMHVTASCGQVVQMVAKFTTLRLMILQVEMQESSHCTDVCNNS
jgi:hypothetical protein